MALDQTQTESLPFDDIVTMVARRYRRKCPWAQLDDLEQVGRLAVVEALPNWEPGMASHGEYVYAAVAFAMKRHLWLESCIVSGGMHRPEQSRAALRTAVLEDDAHEHMGESPELQTDDAMWCARVRARLMKIAPCPETVDVVLEHRTTAEIAAELGVSVAWARNLVAQLKGRIASDEVLYDLITDRR